MEKRSNAIEAWLFTKWRFSGKKQQSHGNCASWADHSIKTKSVALEITTNGLRKRHLVGDWWLSLHHWHCWQRVIGQWRRGVSAACRCPIHWCQIQSHQNKLSFTHSTGGFKAKGQAKRFSNIDLLQGWPTQGIWLPRCHTLDPAKHP